MNSTFCPSDSKIYGKEPRYNETWDYNNDNDNDNDNDDDDDDDKLFFYYRLP